jgi:colanic acid biosynthesis glycosyl transferase WcaI
MRVLLMNQFFWPDRSPTGTFSTDVVRQLVEAGHQVTVLCGGSAYAEGAPARGAEPAARVIRVPSFSFQKGTLGRMLSWVSFLFFAAFRCAFLGRQDVVVSMTTPPGLSVAAAVLTLLTGSRFLIWEMDIYPDVAADTGVLSADSVAYKLVRRVIHWSRMQADQIISLGECMNARLVAGGVPAERLVICENWSDPNPVPPPEPNSRLRVLYAGNLGKAHDTGTIMAAMAALRDEAVEFQFMGGGLGRKEVETFSRAEALSHVAFLPYQFGEDLWKMMQQSDIGLVLQKPEASGTVVPSKVYSSLAAGRPICYVGPRQATPARVIARYGCGWQVEVGDEQGLVALLRRLRENPAEVREHGARAFSAWQNHYTTERGAARVVAVITQGAGSRQKENE